MIINHNLMAINTHRQLGATQTDSAKSTEKLSSGLRINRAGDDAAGLAISEKMRGQIRGLNQASRNSSDTISLIQTAEGALNETHSIIQRMRELAVQAANDTNTDADRKELQSEIDQLIKEVDRIGNTTEFNTKKLLDGSARGVSDNVSATAGLNPNSAVKVSLDIQNNFISKVSEDKNFFMDGAHMLVRINKSEGKDIENDYALVGPDGTQYRFAMGSGTGERRNSLLTANTILTAAQLIGSGDSGGAFTATSFAAFVGSEIGSAISASLAGKTIGTYSGADYITQSAAQSEAMTVARSVIDDLKNKFGQNSVINNALDKILEENAASIKGAVVDTNGTAVVTAPTLTYDTIDSEDSLTKAVNATTTNITIGAGSTIEDGSRIGTGSILAVNSVFTVDAENSMFIEVDGAKLTISIGTGDILYVGSTAVARNASITLNDGTVLKNDSTTNGKLTITQGFVKLAAGADVNENGLGINDLKKNSVIAAGSKLADDSVLGIGTVIGDARNKELIRGSIEFSANANSITFADKHTLSADFSVMDVSLSSTFTFKAFQAGSTDLKNSVMSQVGANSGQIMFVSMNDMRAAALGIDKIDVTNRYAATAAVEKVNNALEKVSHQRATLGAVQNRLEHTIKNLDTAAENLQASESRIRDVDMAKEIMENTKLNILQQASQAMLAQANQAPQSVLQLLR